MAFFLPCPSPLSLDPITNDIPLTHLPIIPTEITIPSPTPVPTPTAVVAQRMKPPIAEALDFLLHPLVVPYRDRLHFIKVLLKVTLTTLFCATTPEDVTPQTHPFDVAPHAETIHPHTSPFLTLAFFSGLLPPAALRTFCQVMRIDWLLWIEGLCLSLGLNFWKTEGFDLIISEEEVVAKPLDVGTRDMVIWRKDMVRQDALHGPEDGVILVDRIPPSSPNPFDDVFKILQDIPEVDIPYHNPSPSQVTPFDVLSRPFKAEGPYSHLSTQFLTNKVATRPKFVMNPHAKPWSSRTTSVLHTHKRVLSDSSNGNTENDSIFTSDASSTGATDSTGSTSPASTVQSAQPSPFFTSPHQINGDSPYTPYTTPPSSTEVLPLSLLPSPEDRVNANGDHENVVRMQGRVKGLFEPPSLRGRMVNEPPRIVALKAAENKENKNGSKPKPKKSKKRKPNGLRFVQTSSSTAPSSPRPEPRKSIPRRSLLLAPGNIRAGSNIATSCLGLAKISIVDLLKEQAALENTFYNTVEEIILAIESSEGDVVPPVFPSSEPEGALPSQDAETTTNSGNDEVFDQFMMIAMMLVVPGTEEQVDLDWDEVNRSQAYVDTSYDRFMDYYYKGGVSRVLSGAVMLACAPRSREEKVDSGVSLVQTELFDDDYDIILV